MSWYHSLRKLPASQPHTSIRQPRPRPHHQQAGCARTTRPVSELHRRKLGCTRRTRPETSCLSHMDLCYRPVSAAVRVDHWRGTPSKLVAQTRRSTMPHDSCCPPRHPRPCSCGNRSPTRCIVRSNHRISASCTIQTRRSRICQDSLTCGLKYIQ